MTAAHHTGRRAYAERAEAETVSNAPAVRSKAERDLADALRLLRAIRRIAQGASGDAASMATALGRISGFTAHLDLEPGLGFALRAAADCAEGCT